MIRRALTALLLGGTVAAFWCPAVEATGPNPPAEYVLHVPTTGAHARPLVLVLPASGWTGTQYQNLTGFNAVADANDFTVAYFEQQQGRSDGGMCCLVPGTSGHRDDVATVRSTINDIASRTMLDMNRVHLVGASGGGFLAWRAACELPDLIAGAAAVVATLGIPRCAPLNGPQSAVRVLNLLGSYDGAVPLRGGPGFESELGRPNFPSAFTARARCLPAGTVVQEVGAYGHAWQPWMANRIWRFLAPIRLDQPPRPSVARRIIPPVRSR